MCSLMTLARERTFGDVCACNRVEDRRAFSLSKFGSKSTSERKLIRSKRPLPSFYLGKKVGQERDERGRNGEEDLDEPRQLFL